jgi:hypothetical protein
MPAPEQALDPSVHELVEPDRLASCRVEGLGGHPSGRPGDHRAEVGLLDQGVHVYPAHQVVDVDRVKDRFEVHPGQDGVHVHLVQQGVEVDLLQDGVDFDAGQDGVQIDAGGELVDIQRADQEIDDALGDLLGESLHRISPGCRQQPVARIHGASIPPRPIPEITSGR